MLSDDLLTTLNMLSQASPTIQHFASYRSTSPRLIRILRECTHYALDNNVVRAATNVVLTKPSNLLENLEFARRPHQWMWVEFCPRVRANSLITGGLEVRGDQPEKVGLLLGPHPRDPDNNLKGSLLVAWRHPGPNAIAELGYCEMIWDFSPEWIDTRTPSDKLRQHEANRGPNNVGFLFSSPREIEAHCSMISRFRIAWAWPHREFITQHLRTLSPERAEVFQHGTETDTQSESAMVLALLLLFNTSKALEHRGVDLTRLNRSRARRNAAPLFAYTHTTIHLSRGRRQSYATSGLSAAEGVALHRVKGHFKSRYSTKRGTKELFWWNEHSRGDAAFGIRVGHRTVKL